MIEQDKSLLDKFVKKGFWLYVLSFAIAPTGYIIKIIISGEVSVSDLGVLYGVISLITLVSSFNDFGMTESLLHFLPRYITEKKYDIAKSLLVYALGIQTITSIFIGSIFFFGADFLGQHFFKSQTSVEVLKVFSVFFLGVNIFQVVSTFFFAIQNTFYNKLCELVRMGSTLLFVVLVFVYDISTLNNFSYAWLFGLIVGIFFSFIVFYFKFYIRYFQSEKIIWSKSLFKEIFSYAILVFVGAQAATILGQVDMQMIIYLLGTQDAGYFTNYLSIIHIPFVIIGPILGFLFPVISELFAKKEFLKIRQIKSFMQKNFIAIGLISNTLFFVYAEVLANILFGGNFLKSGDILRYSILLLTFNFLLQINFGILAGIGKVKERVKIIFIALIFNFFTNIYFISLIGVSGASLATGIGWVLIWALSEKTLGKEYISKWDFSMIAKNLLASILFGAANFFYILPQFESITRVQSLLFFMGISIIWGCFYVLINYKETTNLLKDIKKLKAI